MLEFQPSHAFASVLFFAGIVILYKRRFSLFTTNRKFSLPPSPPVWPFIGNLLQIPTSNDWKTYEAWAKTYGPVMSLSLGILGPRLIILNTLQSARALMSNRSENYADRPDSVLDSLRGGDWFITSLSGPPHRIRRALAMRYFSGAAARIHQRVQQQETCELLQALLAHPSDLFGIVNRYAANIVLLSTYGYRISDTSDPILIEVEKALELTNKSYGTIGFLIDAFPLLKLYPTWLPFSGIFKELAEDKIIIDSSLRDRPFEKSRLYIAEQRAKPCFVSTLLDEILLKGDAEHQEQLIRESAGVMYGAGVDSTATSLSCLFLAAVMFPSFVKKAQSEIDRIIGNDRLPTFEDRGRLPYTEAVVLEILRWNVVTPLGFPHRTKKDDMYGNLLIPEGTTIMVNEWALMRDPTLFPNADSFDPANFFEPTSDAARDVISIVWGWGKRVCPGRQLAEASLFISVASILAAFDISHAKDSDGCEIPVHPEFCSGPVRRPLPFQCSITPRSAQSQELINLHAEQILLPTV